MLDVITHCTLPLVARFLVVSVQQDPPPPIYPLLGGRRCISQENKLLHWRHIAKERWSPIAVFDGTNRKSDTT